MSLSTFVWKWWRFLFPVAGWRRRYQEYKRGRKVWEVPNKPNARKVAPWPVEWLAHTQAGLEGDPKWEPTGWRPIEAECVDTGKIVPPGEAVCCVRCGVPLHPEAAGMVSIYDPPVCRRCRICVALVL